MIPSRESVIAAWLDVVDASAYAREVMCDVERAIMDGVAALEDGEDVVDSLSATQVRDRRDDIDDAWRMLTSSRRHFRVLLVAHCQAAGVDPRRALKAWGVIGGDADAALDDAWDLLASYN